MRVKVFETVGRLFGVFQVKNKAGKGLQQKVRKQNQQIAALKKSLVKFQSYKNMSESMISEMKEKIAVAEEAMEDAEAEADEPAGLDCSPLVSLVFP